MDKPTQEELDAAVEVMQYVLDSTIEHESYAVNAIGTLEAAISEFPRDADEIEEVTNG